jgi:hypothetical protein
MTHLMALDPSVVGGRTPQASHRARKRSASTMIPPLSVARVPGRMSSAASRKHMPAATALHALHRESPTLRYKKKNNDA